MPRSAFDIRVRAEAKLAPLSAAFVQKTASKILKSLGWKKAALSILLVGDAKIRAYNRRYLRHNRTTDVLAFGQFRKAAPRQFSKGLSAAPPFLGDLMICVPMARRQAKVYGNRFRYELCFYLCHGILHLMGYDDRGARQARRMERKQKALLAAVGVRN